MKNHPIPEEALGAMIAVIGCSGDRIIAVDSSAWITAERLRLALRFVRAAGECWLFDGYRPSGQHGRIEFKGQQVYVHRAVYACANGQIPSGLNVCHKCDVGNCVRPQHLFLGTQADNVADMEAKGRARKIGPRGVANSNANLSDEQVAALRLRASRPGTSQRALAMAFGVSQSTVSRLLRGLSRAEAIHVQ